MKTFFILNFIVAILLTSLSLLAGAVARKEFIINVKRTSNVTKVAFIKQSFIESLSA